MKILVVSDVVDNLIYSRYLQAHFKDIDFVLSAGDVPYYYLEYIVTILNVPLYYINGNHDAYEIYKNGRPVHARPLGCENIDGKIVNVNGILIAGLSGSMRYKKGKFQYTESEMKWKIAKLYPSLLYNKIFHKRFVDILLTHSPVAGFGDKPDLCHKGFKVFKQFIDRFRLKLVVHGHIHLYDANAKYVYKYKDTKIINAFGFKVILINEKTGYITVARH